MRSPTQSAHLQIPLKEIAEATDNFADENLIGLGGFGKVYRGKLNRLGQTINIAARRLHYEYGQGDIEFWTEIKILTRLKHENLVSIVGFCDENDEKIIVNKLEANKSLDRYLSGPTLTWMQRLEICVGVAHALRYIQNYDDTSHFNVVHRNIKSSKILLDDNWKPKLSGFNISLKNNIARRHYFPRAEVVGTIGYVDPTYKKTGFVTKMSDIFSLGVVLSEVLCGRRAFILDEHQSFTTLSPLFTMKRLDEYIHSQNDALLTQLVKSHYEEGTLDDIINQDLRKHMNPQSVRIFSETAYSCLKQRAQRPNIDQIVINLEKALNLQQRHENMKHSKVEETEGTSNHLKGKNLEHLEIPLIDIVLATENFAESHLIGSGGYGEVYKSQLDLSINDKKNKGESSKNIKTVAIKRILIRGDKHGEEGFVAEIDLLTRCNHPNIVSLLGYCDEGSHMLLVYEHACNGSLNDYLGSTDKLINLTWIQRIKICIDIARGLDYLHNRLEDERRIIHCDIKSGNILLGKNMEAKIADFGLSRFHPGNRQENTVYTNKIVGTTVYLDPEYQNTGKLKKEIDIYSLGVVLFEILSGKSAYDPIYLEEDDKGLGPVARRRFEEGKIHEMVDPKIMEEVNELIFTLNRGPNQDSLNIFSKTAYQCLAEAQIDRPTTKIIIEELEKALHFQENHKDNLQISLENIKLATQNFSVENLIGGERFGRVHKGKRVDANGCNDIATKQFNKSQGQGQQAFLTELEILFDYKHENVIGLVGYCNEMDEKIIVYEYASKTSLDRHLDDVSLTWMKRLKICIDVATGLDFLHRGAPTTEMVIHRDVKSSNILLNDDWKAKISDFGSSFISPVNQEKGYMMTDVVGTIDYLDPQYESTGYLTKESDIYSFGVVMFEILYGKLFKCNTLSYEGGSPTTCFRLLYDKRHYWNVFKGIKEQSAPKSLSIFRTIVGRCLNDERKKRPTAEEVLGQLNIALEFQEDHEIWEPKLPKDYKEIIQMSKSSEIYSTEKKKDLINLFSNGILLQEDKVWFSLGDTGLRNQMISARKFSYVNCSPPEWQSISESRFQEVAKMLDIANLMIEIKTSTLLTPDIEYGVHLVFKFSNSRKDSSKPTYINLKFRKGSETLSSYFATWRDNNWMMIELYRFLNDKKDAIFELILESFSPYYCREGAIYVEGIEFRPIKNVKQLPRVANNMPFQISRSDVVTHSASWILGKLRTTQSLSPSEVNGQKHLMISPKAALYDCSNKTLFISKPSARSRFQEVFKLLPQQVFRINCTIASQMLSPDTEYLCYLMFKLSKKCLGLHYPLKVQHHNNDEVEIIYLIAPTPWNCHDTIQLPEQREDGWMEVKVWKFNSKHDIKNDHLIVNLKFTSYEETMSGLIVCGLELRPI